MVEKRKDNYLKKELYELIKTDESIFDFIQDSSLDGLWYWDLENPENEWMNPKFWTVLGYNPDEMPHKSSAWQDIINQDDLKTATDNLNKHCENPNHPYDQIVRYTHKNGSMVWIRCRGLAIRNKSGKAIRMLGAHHDITEIKNTELLIKEKSKEYESLNEELLQTNEELYNAKEKTEKSEERFRLIFEKSIMAILIADDKGNYLDVNQAATELFGYSRDEFLRMNVGDLHNPIAHDVSKSYELYIKNGYEKGEFHFINKQGEHRIANYHAIRIREDFNVSILFDITENKKVEEEIIIAKNRSEESEKRFRNMFEFHSAIMLLIEPETGKIIDANKSAQEFYGYDLLTLHSMYIQDINQFNQEQIREERMRALKNKCNYFIFPHKLSNGQVKTVEVHSTPISQGGKQILFSIIHDITERTIAKKELIAAKEKAEKVNRLKTEFLNNMSHEIRTPMNGIIGFSEMLNKPDISDERRKYYSKIVLNGSQQLLRIIDDILEISTLETKQEKLNETAFCLNDLLMELFSIFNLKSNERNIPLYLKKALHDDQSHILSDKTKLNKILGNLLENALKFTSEGFIEFGYYLEKTNLILYVKDTGIGISPKNHSIIFERFAQGEKDISLKHGGLGLGLSICEENAKLLGGEITLESEKGKGSTFYVSIPYKQVLTEENNTTKNIDGTQKSKNKYTILVAEDEEVNYLYIEVLFEDEIEDDYNLIHAKNGQEAVEICMEYNNIDLVLMDIKMPIMNGHEATEKIKEKFPNLPIIAQTAYSTESDKQLALKHGCDDFIPKPINKEELFGMIFKHLNMQ